MKTVLVFLLLSSNVFALEQNIDIEIKNRVVDVINKNSEVPEIYLINDQIDFKIDFKEGSDCILEFKLHNLTFTNDQLCENK